MSTVSEIVAKHRKLNVLPALAFVDQFPSMMYLLRRQFRLAPEFYASALRSFDTDAGAFTD